MVEGHQRWATQLDAALVAKACKGKRDFILFEELDNAHRERQRIVVVMPLGARSITRTCTHA